MISRPKIASLVRSHFPDFNFENYHIKKIVGAKKIKIEHRERNKILPDDLLAKEINERYYRAFKGANVYHYLPKKYVEGITEGKLRLYNLAKYINNGKDDKEYIYFINRMRVLYPNAEEQLKKIVDDVFVLSCTTARDSDEHWKMYGQDEAACIHFYLKNEKSKNVADVRNVVYESELTKLFCLQQCIKEQFDYEVEFSNLNLFSKFTKRSFYEWEKEVRICFDNNMHKIGNITRGEVRYDKYFDVKEDNEQYKYIEIPLVNDFFELKIERVSYK